jgi:hypothetical protein
MFNFLRNLFTLCRLLKDVELIYPKEEAQPLVIRLRKTVYIDVKGITFKVDPLSIEFNSQRQIKRQNLQEGLARALEDISVKN